MDRNVRPPAGPHVAHKSLSARRAWIEIPITLDSGAPPGVSLSARRAWIEIVAWLDYSDELLVALRKESVDRNDKFKRLRMEKQVALRKESVDRNIYYEVYKSSGAVALRKESVDRNA